MINARHDGPNCGGTEEERLAAYTALFAVTYEGLKQRISLERLSIHTGQPGADVDEALCWMALLEHNCPVPFRNDMRFVSVIVDLNAMCLQRHGMPLRAFAASRKKQD